MKSTVLFGFPGGSVIKNPPVNVRDSGLIPRSRRSPGGRNDNPLHYSYLGNPWTEAPGYSPWGHKRVRHNLATK